MVVVVCRSPTEGRPKANRSRRSRELGGVVDWAAVAEFAVEPQGVVLDPEVFDDDAGLGHARSN